VKVGDARLFWSNTRLPSDSNYDFLVLGGGLAGLTFALEAGRRGRSVVVLEREDQVGGLARTLRFGEFRFDIGGHRFHSRWPEITQWVLALLAGEVCDVRRRSRIRLDGKYIDYPLRFPNALTAFSPLQATRILATYLQVALLSDPKRVDVSFEDWIVRRFGRALFDVYFKPYTEKVWGLSCDRISADWASQRIRLPSLKTAVLGSLLGGSPTPSTLVAKFLYPQLGIGVLPARIAEAAMSTGRATVNVGSRVLHIEPAGADRGWTVAAQGPGGETTVTGTQVVSTLPMDRLVGMLPIPKPEADVLATDLPYRSLACVFLTVDGARISDDTWTYFPDRHVLFGRTHEPANWSRRMAPEGATSLCVEVFCSEGDEAWCRPDDDLIEGVVADLDRLCFLPRHRVGQAHLLRVSHAYPVYQVGYTDHLARTTSVLARWPTLHLLGRTGTFRYLNMDAVIRDGLQLAKTLCQAK
jgi:protoporphyrinogen oxidase